MLRNRVYITRLRMFLKNYPERTSVPGVKRVVVHNECLLHYAAPALAHVASGCNEYPGALVGSSGTLRATLSARVRRPPCPIGQAGPDSMSLA